MGLIANYSYLSDANLKELKSLGSAKEEILDYFEYMKGFYKKVLASNGHVMITIY